MTTFALWAPEAGKLDLVVAGEAAREAGHPDRIAMSREGRGWWSATSEGTVDYAFSIDGGPPRPDPRSNWQPAGIDGPSRLVDHARFEWTDQTWRGIALPGAVLYELHVGTFSRAGTFDGAIEHLGHLVDLGIDAVELLPVAEFSGDHGWGYDGVDLFAPHHAYGGPDGLKRLVDACHGHGLGVVMDVVYNHVGPAGNYLSEFGPYFTSRHTTNWGEAVNFDGPGSDEVRRFVIDNACMWLRDYHCDGLRLDAVHAIKDDSSVHILEELALRVQELGAHLRRPLFLVAESDLNDPRFVRPAAAGGYGMDAAWADEFHHALHAALTGERSGYYSDFGALDMVAKAARQAWVYDGRYSAHRQRHHGRPPLGLNGSQFVACLQNHDQVGNRAGGERITQLTSEGRAMIGAALLLCSPFVPMIFQGEEWAASSPFLYFTDHRDEALGRAVSEGRRNEFSSFGWEPGQVPDPQDPGTFRASTLDWSEVNRGEHGRMLGWYRTLIGLRRQLEQLGSGPIGPDHITTGFDGDEGWLTVTRGDVMVACNLGAGTLELPLPCRRHAVILAGSDERVSCGARSIHLPPDSAAVVQLADHGGRPSRPKEATP